MLFQLPLGRAPASACRRTSRRSCPIRSLGTLGDTAARSSRRRTVVVGLSGGVDSAVAALTLKRAGFDVVGIIARNWDESEESGAACGYEKDLRDAQSVARTLGIPLHEVDFVREYWHDVFEGFLRSYAAGKTPNPDLACNRMIKFGALLSHVRAMGADALATGHYAQIGSDSAGRAVLLRATDRFRDQSYFLAAVGYQALSQALFPVGGLTKEQVPPQDAARPCASDGRSSAMAVAGPGARGRGGAAHRRRQEKLDGDMLHRQAKVRRLHQRVRAGRPPLTSASAAARAGKGGAG